MRSVIIFLFIVFHFVSFSQKVTLTPISFNRDFTLENLNTKALLKDYTQFSQSPFKKVPKGFTLSDASVFYKFDTLNCSLHIRKREDIKDLLYYRDCEDGRYCTANFKYTKFENIELREYRQRFYSWDRNLEGCCDLDIDFDTTALFYKNEYVDFVDFISLDKNIPFSILRNDYVTNEEYREFMDYCIDSINRYILAEIDTLLIANAKTGEGPINYSRKYNQNTNLHKEVLSTMYYYPHERLNRLKIRDSRKIVLTLRTIPRDIAVGLNLPDYNEESPTGINKKKIKRCSNVGVDISYSQLVGIRQKGYSINKIEDEKTQMLAYSFITLNYSINPDTLSWITDNRSTEKSNYLIWASENYFNKNEYKELPVQGVNYWQASSFLGWKTYFHNRQLRREGANYRVLYTFPLPEEVTSIKNFKIKTPEIDFEKYIITNKEYELFVTYVVDSISFQLKFENYSGSKWDKVSRKLKIKTYDDYGELDPPEYWLNNQKNYMKLYLKSVKEIKKDSLHNTFEGMMIPESHALYSNMEGLDSRKIFFVYNWAYYDKDSIKLNKNLNLSKYSDLGYSHVYNVEDRSPYFIREYLNIFPGYDARDLNKLEESILKQQISNFANNNYVNGKPIPIPDSLNEFSEKYVGNWKWEKDSLTDVKILSYDFKKAPNEPITAINYEQAKAYYHWKNEVTYIPTKEEWKQIQKGINPYEVKELDVPGPFFRYAIRVYPVREEER